MTPMTLTPPAGRRGGFTLVELLVAAGLSVLVMAILATAFQQGMETLSHLKSAVTLSQQLRSVEGVMRRDLGARHLEDGSTGNTVHVSNREKILQGWRSPNKGYFRVEIPTVPVLAVSATPTTPFVDEGAEEGVNSYRATDHKLMFTCRYPGGSPSEVVTAGATGLTNLLAQSQKNMVDTADADKVFAGVWAEVGYFLDDTFLTTTDANGTAGFKLYTLRRWVRSLAPNQQPLQSGVDAKTFYELSVSPAGNINTPADVAMSAQFANSSPPGNRAMFPGTPAPGIARSSADMAPLSDVKNAYEGSDVLLSNVVSMQVMPMLDPMPNMPQNTKPTYLDNPRESGGAAWSYDTFDPPVDTQTTPAVQAGTPPRRYGLRAVQIKLRVYDVRNRMTRQVTIAQDL